LISKFKGEVINSILRLLLQEGARLGQEDNINHHWDFTPEREPIVCNLCCGKSCPELYEARPEPRES